MIKCVHYWRIDSDDYAKCLLCGDERNFKPEVDKALGCETRAVRKDFHYERNMVVTGGFYLQGSVNRLRRTADYCFSVDQIE